MPRFDTTDDPIAHDNYPLVSSSSDDARVDSSVVGYTPDVLTDWDGDADPGDVDAALDQLAERVDDNENALSSLTDDHGELQGLADDDHTQYVLADGTRGLSADWDAGDHEVRARTLQADVATGTAPLTIASTTLVSNLNADKLDGNDAADFAASSHNHAALEITSGVLAHERGGLEADVSAVAKGDVLAGTGTGSIGIVAASGASDGDVLTVQGDGSVAYEALPTVKRAHTFYYANPQSGKAYVAAKLPASATITRIDHVAIGSGSSLDFNVEIRNESTPEATGTQVWTTDQTANTTHSTEMSFNNDSVSAHQILFVTITALGGTAPDAVYIGIELEDD